MTMISRWLDVSTWGDVRARRVIFRGTNFVILCANIIYIKPFLVDLTAEVYFSFPISYRKRVL